MLVLIVFLLLVLLVMVHASSSRITSELRDLRTALDSVVIACARQRGVPAATEAREGDRTVPCVPDSVRNEVVAQYLRGNDDAARALLQTSTNLDDERLTELYSTIIREEAEGGA